MSRLLELHRAVRTWAASSCGDPPQPLADGGATLGYIDLFFAFGLARCSDANSACQLVKSARVALGRFDPSGERGMVAGFLLRAFTYRIEQALAGEPHSGFLPRELLTELGEIAARLRGQFTTTHGLSLYAIQRMREISVVLEPVEKPNSYAEFSRNSQRWLAELQWETDPEQIAGAIRNLLHQASPADRHFILLTGLSLAVRVQEPFAAELVGRVLEILGDPRIERPWQRWDLLTRSLDVVAYFQLRDKVRPLIEAVLRLMAAAPEVARFELLAHLANRCFRVMRGFGMTAETVELLNRLGEIVFDAATPEQVREQYRSVGTTAVRAKWGRSDRHRVPWSSALEALLGLAEGWLGTGHPDRAEPILALARSELLDQNATPFESKDYAPVARAYVRALGRMADGAGVPQVVALFSEMDSARVCESLTTSTFFSRVHLGLVEEAVLAETQI
jgi:hypothetical protein